MSEVLFKLNELTVRYGNEPPVLRNLSMDLVKGSRIGLVGRNGSGKSTLLSALVGLMDDFDGELWAFGKWRRDDSDFAEVRRRAGLLFEDPDDQLFNITVSEDVAFGPFNLGWPRERVITAVRDTLARLDLSGYEERITYRLSKGEKRMVSIASVLAMDPEVLLLDEPTAGLDHRHTRLLEEILKQSSKTLLVVSHDRDFLASVTNQTIQLENGQAVYL